MEPDFCFLPPELLILHCSKHADAFIAGAVHALSGNALGISADCFLFTPYQVLVDLMPSDESDFVHT
ncbi:MAG: hypothetical protein BTM30_02765 [Synechococcus lacustris str. Tous]|nr:MAG: hypothetical protein BTM30_02765 [Synechococcus lacustris str. Tous]